MIAKQAQIIRQLAHEKENDHSQGKGKSPGKLSLTQRRVQDRSVSPGKSGWERAKMEERLRTAELGLGELLKGLSRQQKTLGVRLWEQIGGIRTRLGQVLSDYEDKLAKAETRLQVM